MPSPHRDRESSSPRKLQRLRTNPPSPQRLSAQSPSRSTQRKPRAAAAQYRSRKPISSQSALAPFRLRAIIAGGLAVFCAALITVMPAMGLRLEHQDLTPAEPSHAEQTRQNLALQAQKIAASRSLNPDNGELFDAADSWVSQLGGVWVPWPAGAPEGYENPHVDTSGYASLEELRHGVWEFSNDVYSFNAQLLADTHSSANTQPSADDSQNLALSQLGPTLALEALSYGAALDQQAGISTHCGELSAEEITTLSQALQEDSHLLSQLSTAQQWLDYQAALSAQSLDGVSVAAQEKYETTSKMLMDLIDAALAAGSKDSRPVMAPPPNNESSVQEGITSALAALIAAHSESEKNIEEARIFSCSVLVQLSQ